MTLPWLEDLNDQQKKAVCFDKGPLLVLAGAGSGKTRALTYRAAWLIKQNQVDPSRILLLTFTNKAAGEMKSRIKKLVKTAPPFSGTFHSFCVQVLKREAKHLKLDPNFVIFDTADQKQAVKSALERLDLSKKEFRPSSVLSTISQAKNELVSASEYSGFARGHWQKTVSKIYMIYQKLLSDYNALDFDDLLVKTVELFKNQKPVLKKYQQKYQYVLVDEYQDTNHSQYVLTKLLANQWRNLNVVGDASQSIYRWRGADFRNILNLKSDYPDITTIHLEQNYRSTQNILDSAYAVINKNTTHPILELWTHHDQGEKVKVVETRDEKVEAQYVAEHASSLKRSKLNKMAVLYRTNAQSRVLEEAFVKLGLPYRLVGGTRFYERKEIKDALAYLRLINNPKDMISFKRIQKLGKRRMEKFLDISPNLEANQDNLTTQEILDKIFSATGYLDFYDKKVEEDLARLENLDELKSVAQEFPSLGDFLIQVALVEQDHFPDGQSSQTTNQEAVTLMTLHAAKGLEFETVFMTGMEEGLFPHSRSLLEKEELEEERRLCYVGITRAKKNLYLSYARRRLYFGRTSQNLVSRFINDLPADLIEMEAKY